MSLAIALTDEQWELVADLFGPPGRRGAPARIARRQMVEAMLFIARTGCQWRYLPERYGTWSAVWAQWRRWRADGVWARAMLRLAAVVRPLYKIEHTFAQLGRWRRLSRCYEGSEASATAWLEVASVGYLAWRAVARPRPRPSTAPVSVPAWP